MSNVKYRAFDIKRLYAVKLSYKLQVTSYKKNLILTFNI